MSVATKAEEIYTLLRAVTLGDWAKTVTIDSFKLALDPMSAIDSGLSGVFVVPVVTDYNIEQSNRRVNVISTAISPRVAVTLAFPFATKDSTGIDVSSWDEVKALLNFREQIEQKIIKNIPNIQSVDPEPAVEISLEKRWYLAMTEFYFHAVQC
jgi:hypothetical protein